MPDTPPGLAPSPLPARVTYAVRDAVAEIGLQHPPANALTEPMLDQLLAALARAAGDDAVRAVILHGSGGARFCAGLDLKQLQHASPDALRGLLDKLYTRLTEAQHALGKPSIAAVAGAARGGGMTLSIGCDLIVAGEGASFGYPEIDVGLMPAIHFTHLHRIVGRYRAFDLLFTARTFGAAEAQQLGLVSRVVPDDQVLDQARALAQVLAAKPPGALRLARAAFHNGADHGWRQGVAGAVETFCAAAVTADGREGVAAFAEKRPPAWAKPRA